MMTKPPIPNANTKNFTLEDWKRIAEEANDDNTRILQEAAAVARKAEAIKAENTRLMEMVVASRNAICSLYHDAEISEGWAAHALGVNRLEFRGIYQKWLEGGDW